MKKHVHARSKIKHNSQYRSVTHTRAIRSPSHRSRSQINAFSAMDFAIDRGKSLLITERSLASLPFGNPLKRREHARGLHFITAPNSAKVRGAIEMISSFH